MTAPKFTRKRQRTFHDRHIRPKTFEPDQKVWLFNSKLRLFPWQAPLQMGWPVHSYFSISHGAVELRDPKDGNIFKVNGQRLKPCIQNPDPGTDVESVKLTDPTYSF
jgi:hypothetical protein